MGNNLYSEMLSIFQSVIQTLIWSEICFSFERLDNKDNYIFHVRFHECADYKLDDGSLKQDYALKRCLNALNSFMKINS